MEKRRVVYIIVAVVVFAVVFAVPKPAKESLPDTKVVFIGKEKNVSVYVEVADEQGELRKGLMYRQSLPENQGMLFVFKRTDVLRFWMKNTLIPLDMIFISPDFRIVNITRNAQPCKSDPCNIYSSGAPARYVVEVNGGFCDRNGISEGDYVFVEYGKEKQ